jgi:hypothetical protein
MCKQGHECVGWGVDGATGMPTRFPVIALTYDAARTDKIFHGKLEPLEVEATPNPNPTWAFSPVAAQDDTHAFATIGEFSGYVDATYAGAAPPMGTSSYSVYTMRKEDVLGQFYQQPGQDTALTVARAAKSFITMELPFDPATKTLHYAFDRHANDAALSLPSAYETDDHKRQFLWFIEKYGTSYARTASMGALIEQRTSWQTPLRDQDKFDTAMLTKNANIDFAKSAQLDGPGSAHDAPYPDKATNALVCAGGDSTIACAASAEGMTNWKASVDTAQHLVLLSFDLQPISTLLPAAVGPSFEKAVQAYLDEQRQEWKQADKCPASCNSRGFCRAPDSVQCTCACYFGNGCSGGPKDGCTDTCSDGSSPASCAAWVQFFDSTNGNAWGPCSANRNTPSGCAGVKHSGADITEIALPNMGLEGTLPPSLGQLTAMKRLALMGNNLYGEVPDLSGATALERLELNSNAFGGAVPASLGGMAGLQELWLSQNQFSSFGDALAQGFVDCSVSSSGQPCCDLSENAFPCPLPAWLNSSKCEATCTP